ncbi:MAG: hypothetical protein J6Y00_08195 [Paludibacteraceae bacterium]|nr:hypothetical protein [Paludibacteraceae bacterium]
MNKFSVISIPNVPHRDDRKYAFFYSGDYETIMGETMKNQGKVTRYICIANEGRKVYKQYYSFNNVSKGQIALDYESICNLGVNIGDNVNVYPISKICYHWHTGDSIAKLSLLIAIFSIVLCMLF